jgi:hypothetical protein
VVKAHHMQLIAMERAPLPPNEVVRAAVIGNAGRLSSSVLPARTIRSSSPKSAQWKSAGSQIKSHSPFG